MPEKLITILHKSLFQWESRLGTRTATEVTFAPAPPITGFLEFAVKTYEFAGLPSGRRFVYAVSYSVIKPDPMAIIMSMSILIVILLCGREWVKSPGGYPKLQRRRDLASKENEKIFIMLL